MIRSLLTEALHVALFTERREAVPQQPANLLLQDEEDRPLIYECHFCGAPSAKDPSEQDMPIDYCHPEDHQ